MQKKHIRKGQMLVFAIIFTLVTIGAASAADNSSDNQTTTSLDHVKEASNSLTATNNSLSINTTTKSSSQIKDPQIWNGGVPVSRGGQLAGYNWGTIQNAIDHALPGDTIMLENGVTFTGTGNTQITLTKNLNFDVLDGGTAIIDGGGNRWGFVINNGITVTFNNIIFQNMYTLLSGAALENNGGTLNINNCILRNNRAILNGGAIYNHDDGNLNVDSCSIYNNQAGSGSGIYTRSNGLVSITNNNIYNNIYNIINGDGTGISVHFGNPTITGNNIYGNWRGIYINSGNAVISNNNIYNNGHINPQGDGIWISDGNPLITGNNIRNNADDGIHVNGCSGSSSNPLQIHYNSIVDNGKLGLHAMNGVYVNAANNWWGSNNPSYIRQLLDPSYPRDIFEQRLSISSQRVSWDPYLYLRISANTPIYNGDTSTVTAYLTRDNHNNIAPGTVPNGTTVTFSLTNGPYGSLTSPLTRSTSGGVATIPFVASDPNAPHTQNVRATVDHQQVTTGIVINPKAYVTMTKTGNGPLNVGQTGTFTITVTNNGPNTAQNVQVNDPAPAGFTLGSFSTGNYVGNVWTIPSLANGASATLTFNRVMTAGDAGTTKTNTATATQTTYNPSPIQPQTATIYVKNAVLTITKTSDKTNYNIGDNVVYNIDVLNNGPDTATNVVVTDTLQSGLTYVSSTLGGTYNTLTRTITWNLANLPNGIHFQPSFTATVNTGTQGQTIPNTASTANDQITTPVTSPTSNIHINNAVLTITKTSDKTNYNIGENVIYNIDVLNNGPDTATNIIVTDTLQSGLTYVSSTLGGTYNTITRTITWNLANLPNGIHFQPSFTATVNTGTQGQTIPNTASTANDQITTPVTSPTSNIHINNAVLTITKTSDKTNYNIGENVIYNIDVLNNGPDTATNIIVTDTLQSGLTYVSSTLGGTYNTITRTITWNLANLPNGIHYNPSFTATVNVGTQGQTIPNTASTANDQITTPVTSPTSNIHINNAVLTITKTSDKTNYNIGENVIYNIDVLNNGPDTATNIIVTDTLQSGLTYVSSTNGGVWDPATRTVTWTVGNLASSAHFVAAVTSTIKTLGGKTLVNTAQAQDDQMDYPVSTTASIYIKKCNLYVNVSPTIINTTVGNIVTITYKVGNKGPDDANGVVMTFVIPNGLEFVSASSPDSAQPTYDVATRTLTWNLGDVPVGDPILKLNVRVLRAGTFIITPTIVSRTCTGQTVIVSATTINAQSKVDPNDNTKTIGMQKTGAPIGALILAVLTVLAGMILPKRKN